MNSNEKNDKIIPNNDSIASGNEIQRKSVFTASKSSGDFNVAAPPFRPPKYTGIYPVIQVGPSNVPVNKNIWQTVANNRVFPEYPKLPHSRPLMGMPILHPSMSLVKNLTPIPAHFEDDYAPNIVFTRKYGPVVHPDGFVEIRLKENICVFITVDRSLLLLNPNSNVKIAVATGMSSAAMEHPNGKIFQQFDRTDIQAYDGTKKLNNFVRYAKMWEKGISLTADGCALIYLVDSAGTRTTSDAVNKDYRSDNCWKVFSSCERFGGVYFEEAEAAAKNYHFFIQEDGSNVFDVLGFRITQTIDGMVRVCRSNNRLKIHTSPTNGSATLTTPNIHCTASMGQSSHLFVRRDERRMHFDGTTFVVRNAGHSSGFDDQNNLRVY